MSDNKIIIQRILKYSAIMAAFVGIVFLIIVPGYYSFLYVTDTANSLRKEYLVGATMSAALSIGFWVAAVVLFVISKLLANDSKNDSSNISNENNGS